MHKIVLPVLAVLILMSCNSSSQKEDTEALNSLTQKETNEGWQLLFDGKSTNGWHSYGLPNTGAEWKVADGILHLAADTQTVQRDLVTNETFGNFDLKLDWKISDKGNSGIIFYVQEDTLKYHQTYNTGMEMQVLDNGTPIRHGHPDGRLYSHRAGDLYDLLASKEAVHPLGEWNHIEIKCDNGDLNFYMNGTNTLSLHLWDDNWKKMVALGKFKDMPGFGTFKQGRIALQDHGDDVWFKNIRIRKL